jgi:hypothetical protein
LVLQWSVSRRAHHLNPRSVPTSRDRTYLKEGPPEVVDGGPRWSRHRFHIEGRLNMKLSPCSGWPQSSRFRQNDDVPSVSDVVARSARQHHGPRGVNRVTKSARAPRTTATIIMSICVCLLEVRIRGSRHWRVAIRQEAPMAHHPFAAERPTFSSRGSASRALLPPPSPGCHFLLITQVRDRTRQVLLAHPAPPDARLLSGCSGHFAASFTCNRAKTAELSPEL